MDSAVVVVVRLLSDEIEAAIPMLLGDAKANTRAKAVKCFRSWVIRFPERREAFESSRDPTATYALPSPFLPCPFLLSSACNIMFLFLSFFDGSRESTRLLSCTAVECGGVWWSEHEVCVSVSESMCHVCVGVGTGTRNTPGYYLFLYRAASSILVV